MFIKIALQIFLALLIFSIVRRFLRGLFQPPRPSRDPRPEPGPAPREDGKLSDQPIEEAEYEDLP